MMNRIRAAGYDLFLVLEVTVGFNRRDKSGASREEKPLQAELAENEFRFTNQDTQFLRALRISVDEKSRTIQTQPAKRHPGWASSSAESPHAAAVCVDGAADCWATTSVGIAGAATAPKKTIPISSNNAVVSEKVGSGCRGDGLSGPGKGRKVADGTVWENRLCSEARLRATGCMLVSAGRPKN